MKEKNGTDSYKQDYQMQWNDCNATEPKSYCYSDDDYYPFSDDDIDPEFGLLPFTLDDLHSPTHRLQSSLSSSRSVSPDSNQIELLNTSLSTIGSSSEDDIIANQNDFEDCPSTSEDEDRVSLVEINAKIGSPPANNQNGKRLNLETIYEGVFLDTPPKKVSKSSLRHQPRCNGISNMIQFKRIITDPQDTDYGISSMDFIVVNDDSSSGCVLSKSFQKQLNF